MAVSHNSVSRLMRDLSEWHRSKDELPLINAEPLDDNIYEWHCNVTTNDGDFKGVVLHLILKFSDQYPLQPPKGMCLIFLTLFC